MGWGQKIISGNGFFSLNFFWIFRYRSLYLGGFWAPKCRVGYLPLGLGVSLPIMIAGMIFSSGRLFFCWSLSFKNFSLPSDFKMKSRSFVSFLLLFTIILYQSDPSMAQRCTYTCTQTVIARNRRSYQEAYEIIQNRRWEDEDDFGDELGDLILRHLRNKRSPQYYNNYNYNYNSPS